MVECVTMYKKMPVNVRECDDTSFSAKILLIPALFYVLIPNMTFILAGKGIIIQFNLLDN